MVEVLADKFAVNSSLRASAEDRRKRQYQAHPNHLVHTSLIGNSGGGVKEEYQRV
jgi:hypothetical protein